MMKSFFIFAVLIISFPVFANDLNIYLQTKSIEQGKESSNITAIGHWVADQELPAPFIPVINNTEIVCDKGSMSCNEIMACLVTELDNPKPGRRFLIPVNLKYKVIKWDEKEINALSSTRVADVRVSVDLREKNVTKEYTEIQGKKEGESRKSYTWRLE